MAVPRWRHKHQWRFGATLNRFDVIAVIARENESEKTLPVAIKFADDMTFIAVGANTLQSRQHPVTDGQCLAAAFINNQQISAAVETAASPAVARASPSSVIAMTSRTVTGGS